MQDLKRKIGGTVLAVAAAGAGAIKPVSAGGYFHAPNNTPMWGGYYHADAGPHYGNWEFDLGTMFERMRKKPLEHKAYSPGDLRARAVCPPYCPPFWGYNEPRWRQLPSPVGTTYPATYDVSSPPVPGAVDTIPPPAPAAPQTAPPYEPAEPTDDFPPIAPPATSADFPVIQAGPSLTSADDDGWSAHRPRP